MKMKGLLDKILSSLVATYAAIQQAGNSFGIGGIDTKFGYCSPDPRKTYRQRYSKRRLIMKRRKQ